MCPWGGVIDTGWCLSSLQNPSQNSERNSSSQCGDKPKHNNTIQDQFPEAFGAPSAVFLCVCPDTAQFRTTRHTCHISHRRDARNFVSGSRGCCLELAAVAATKTQQRTARHITWETRRLSPAFRTTAALLNARSGSMGERAAQTLTGHECYILVIYFKLVST